MTDKKNLYQRLHKIMEDLPIIPKDNAIKNKAGVTMYSVTTSDAVTAALRPLLIKHGVLASQSVETYQVDGNRTEAHTVIEFINIDNPDERYAVKSFGFGVDAQDKGPGKAMSYAMRYGISKIFSLQSGDDPEREQVDYKPQTRSTAAPRQTRTSQPQAETSKVSGIRQKLFPDLPHEWPPKNEKDYDIAITGKLKDSASDAFRGKVRGTITDAGYAGEDQRRALLTALYTAFKVPTGTWATTSSAEFTKGHAFFVMSCIEHENFQTKAADDPLPWQTKKSVETENPPQTEADLTPDPDCDLDADIDTGQLDKEPENG